MAADDTLRSRRPSPAGHGREFVYATVDEVDRAALRVAISPLPTALTLTRDALQDGRRGSPAAWRKAIVGNLRARDMAALAPLADRRSAGWPTLLDAVGARRETIDEALGRVAAATGDAVLQALETDRDIDSTVAWDPVRRDPGRWIGAYVDAIQRGWQALEPLWRRSAALLEHEVDRLDAAIERGVAPSQILEEIGPRTALAGAELRIARDAQPRYLRVDERGVTLAPIICSSRAGTLSAPCDVWLQNAYPLRESWRAFEDEAPPPASLRALLGLPRAALLERLDTPRRAGELAEALGLSPSAVTFHLRALEASGLIRRQRHGRHVVVHRTARGDRLIALYA